jgi:hypothetical protein
MIVQVDVEKSGSGNSAVAANLAISPREKSRWLSHVLALRQPCVRSWSAAKLAQWRQRSSVLSGPAVGDLDHAPVTEKRGAI